MRPFSLDLRQRVVEALQSGQTRPQVSERFGVSLATVGRLIKQFREQNHLTPRPIPGRPRSIGHTEREFLQSLIATQKDPTLASLSQALEEKTGKKVSKSALQRNLVWLSYSYKKSRVLLPRETRRSGPRSRKP